ncbi:MAG: SusE domain-containing protein [Bacteroidales bacterium]|nr:SusE domain-containing protein [Bacteroidales bacterium]
MKKTTIIIFSLLCIIGFTSCEEDPITKINPKAEDGTLSFKLNETSYSEWTYVLEDANAEKDMDSLTCVQPDYGFTAAVTYTTQVCFDPVFADGTYESLATTVNGEKVGINTKQMDKAIIALYGGKLPEPVVEKEVYIRLKAFVSNATHSALTDSLMVKPLYSNAIKLNILPYVLPLFPYIEVTPRLWFIVGLGDGAWTNSVDGLGKSLIPLDISEGKKYNMSGDGEFTYTGYFQASRSFKLIRDYKTGSWSESWGMTGSNYVHNGGDNISVPSDGYYTVTLNSIDNTLTIEPATITPTVYTTIGLIGGFNDWGGDEVLLPTETTNNHVWYKTYTFAAESQCKLRANADWGTNWGTPSSEDGNPLYSNMGIGVNGGKNMIETAGTYTIIFNDISGCYYFIKK